MGVMGTSVICVSILLCLGSLVLTSTEQGQERQLTAATSLLDGLLGLTGAGLTGGAVAGLANSNALLAALAGSGINGLTGAGPVVSGLAGAGVSDLLTGDGNGIVDNLISGGKGGKAGKGGKEGKGGKAGKGGKEGKGVKGKGGKGKGK